MGIQDDETLQMYVEESREHLADIENDLLTIEESGADIDEELVNKVFRAAHSIKGGAGFMGLTHIKELSHKIENVLGMIRSRQIAPNREIVNTLLIAFDKLRELISNVDESDATDISEHIDALTALTTESLPEPEKESISRKVDVPLPDGRVIFSIPQFDVNQAAREGKFIYLIEYDLLHDVQRQGKAPLDILNSLQDSGIVMDSKVDIAAVGELEEESLSNRIPFYVLLATIIDPSIVGALCEVDDAFIHLIPTDSTATQEPQAGVEAHYELSRSFATDAAPMEYESPAPVEPVEAVPDPPIEYSPGGYDGFSSAGATPEPPAPKREEPERASARKANAAPAETSLRVHISLLDTLMTLAGEMVLARNQLLQAITSKDGHAIDLSAQKVNMVTSELQEAIMQTRMQPIGNIFNKFPRVVRDLAGSQGKSIELALEGKEVELDKTIIEGLSDPLTHLVRNSIDHAIEPPEERASTGKSMSGQIVMKAYHEAGQVNIEISDDGRGIDGAKLASKAIAKGFITAEQARAMSEKEKINLIFTPGFSTAEKVTDISGRGVGMDVVKTNLDRLGGVIDIESHIGEGTAIRIKLPLTLAIIPSLIVSVGEDRFAIPQVNVDELLRIPASQVKDRVERVGDAEVVRLRGTLLPLVKLSELLGIEKTYLDSDGMRKPDRRRNICDRRSRTSPLFYDEADATSTGGPGPNEDDRRSLADRRYHATSAVHIVVVSAGPFKYGLVIDKLHDSEEIVVKPLGRHLKHCRGYAGATIMGDGRVALILDVGMLAQMATLTSLAGSDRAIEVAQEAARAKSQDVQSLLLFRNAPDEQFAVPLDLVGRVEQIRAEDIEIVGGRRVIKYRGGSLPVFAIEDAANVKPSEYAEKLLVIVFTIAGREVGLLASPPLDAMEIALAVDPSTLRQPGVMGSTIIGSQTTLLIDIFELMEIINPEWFSGREAVMTSSGGKSTLLLAEDSDFFRGLVQKFIEDEGYEVIPAEDGQIAWERLQENSDKVALVVTDIEMPNMDGYELTKKIRADKRFKDIKIIAVTSLAGDEDIGRGKEVGVDDYQIKLDKEKLLESIHTLLQ